MSTDEIINEAQALPPEERAAVVDSLLRSLNPPDPKMDAAWTSVARERASELHSGSVKAVPGDEILSRLKKHFPTQ